jgi:lipid II:glycine glycyltransferase (peptidoglycan interpeptide bridge formation enzyme)
MLFESLQDSTKRNIRKAIREQVVIHFSNSLESVKSFYRLHIRNRQLHGLPPQPSCFFRNIQRHVLAARRGQVVEALYKGRIIAASIFLHFGRWAIYKYGASDPAFLQYRPNNLIMWEAIRFYAQNGFRQLSFGRTDPEDTGLARYKDGWGTQRECIQYFRFALRKKASSSGKAGDRTSGLVKKVPAFLLPAIGKLLYKHFA